MNVLNWIYQKLFCCSYLSICDCCDVNNVSNGGPDDNRSKQLRKLTHATSLRGNMVRTYTASIEDDFYLDVDQELGKGGCGVVVVGESKDTHAQYAIKIVNKISGSKQFFYLQYL
jgi:hypothetical protein